MKLQHLYENFTLNQIQRLWREINQVSFDGQLTEPLILLEHDLNHLIPKESGTKQELDKVDGKVVGFCDEDPETHGIVLLFWSGLDDPKEALEVVAHEMVHQALAEKFGYQNMIKMRHGEEFMSYAKDIAKYHGTKLTNGIY